MVISVPVFRDESINYFDPDVNPFPGEDFSIFDKLSQDTKGINIHMPPPSPRLNPYLPDNHSKNRHIAFIEITKEKVVSSTLALTPQVQVNPQLDRKTKQR
jgi:hypothetical protein